MRLEHLPLDQTMGTILIHNIVDGDGHKVLPKGRQVGPEDVAKLQALGHTTAYVAVLGPEDVREDAAAARIAKNIPGTGIEQSRPSGGRVNLYATQRGFLSIDTTAQSRLNALDGITLATLPRFAPVGPKKIVGTLKTIGLALPEARVREAERIPRESGGVLRVAPVVRDEVCVILSSSPDGRSKVNEVFGPPIQQRIESLGAQVASQTWTLEEEESIAQAIVEAIRQAGAKMIILAGETSIMDADDTVPRGIRKAGGQIELYGAPVEPGNLLLLAYCGSVPVIGAPGCIKSKETNVVDLILPRLLAGERVRHLDVLALAEGGLLVG